MHSAASAVQVLRRGDTDFGHSETGGPGTTRAWRRVAHTSALRVLTTHGLLLVGLLVKSNVLLVMGVVLAIAGVRGSRDRRTRAIWLCRLPPICRQATDVANPR